MSNWRGECVAVKAGTAVLYRPLFTACWAPAHEPMSLVPHQMLILQHQRAKVRLHTQATFETETLTCKMLSPGRLECRLWCTYCSVHSFRATVAPLLSPLPL